MKEKPKYEKEIITAFGYMCITSYVFEEMTDEQKDWVRELIKHIIKSLPITPKGSE